MEPRRDALGRVLTVTLPAVGGRAIATTCTCDHLDAATGFLYTEITDPSGNVTTYVYDGAGRLADLAPFSRPV